MKNILDIKQAIELSNNLKKERKKTVLVGGCFDILHPGHIQFLDHAKKSGDVLLVFLESDKKITEMKGIQRPLHTQQERAAMLVSLRFVDVVILLPYFSHDQEYNELIKKLQPHIIATTEGDPHTEQKKRQAESVGAKVIEVIKYIPHKSTTRLLKILANEM